MSFRINIVKLYAYMLFHPEMKKEYFNMLYVDVFFMLIYDNFMLIYDNFL